MTNYCGYTGKVLVLDLTNKTTENYIWTDLDREKYIGGKAMASKILYDNLTGSETPFGPENLIVIATGPLTGTGAPSSNRFDISSLSPLTGITSSSNCGGNFGHYLKKAGLDALIIRGACDKLSWVEIDNGEFVFHDAGDLRDLKCGETQEALQKKLDEAHGKPVRCGMVCIGPAGENLVRYASVISGERAAGRAGMGAVFGSKKLKAITAAGDAVPAIYDKEGAAEHGAGALVRLDDAEQHAQSRGLAGAVRAEHAIDEALGHRDVDAVDDAPIPEIFDEPPGAYGQFARQKSVSISVSAKPRTAPARSPLGHPTAIFHGWPGGGERAGPA